MRLLSGLLLIVAAQFGGAGVLSAEQEHACGGYTTLLYANDSLALSLCHAPYTKIDRTGLRQWQDCDDAMLQLADKKSGKTSVYYDCGVPSRKQFRLEGDSLMLRHFYTDAADFELHPLMVESHNLLTQKKHYVFVKQFAKCTVQDIQAAHQQVEMEINKPFDGRTYFTHVYGGLLKLRDCAASDSAQVLAAFKQLQQQGQFDGEVAETYSILLDEVELIGTAIRAQN